MNCAEFHELAAAYAVDALPEEERLSGLHHLTHEGPHDGCEQLVARYERVADRLASTLVPVEPPPGLWRILELRLGLVGQAGASLSPLGKLAPQPSRWREQLSYATAAAALLGALWSHQTAQKTVDHAQRERGVMEDALANTSGQLATAETARRDCTSALEQLTREGALGRDAVSMLEQPATKLAPMGPTGAQTYRATALYNAETRRAVVISTTVPRVAGKDYELWVIAAGPGQAPQPAGFLRFDPSGVAVGEFDAALLARTPAAFAVSLEPAGGRPTPTEVVLLAKLPG
ncbi:MAG: hypothetical protein JWN04_1651 [Myxococcaceae bacterium]|nr:hypothetical protein [Myxococcaceae bacterium]